MQSVAAVDKGGEHVFAITLRSNPLLMVGVISIHEITPGMVVLGYWIGASYRRRGFAGEAARAVAAFALEHLPVTRIRAECRTTNLGSRRVLERAGFQVVGRARHKSAHFGRYLPTLVFALDRT